MALTSGSWTAISLAIFLILMSIAEIVTSQLALDFSRNRIRNPFRITDYRGAIPDASRPYAYIYNIPEQIQYGGLWAVFAIAIVALASCLLLLIAIFSPAHGKQTRPNFTSLPLLASVVAAIAAPIALVYSMIQHYQSSYLDADDVLSFRGANSNEDPSIVQPAGSLGSWDLEAWTCQTKVLWSTRTLLDGYGRTCGLAAAARWMTIPMLLVSWALLVAVFIQYRSRRKSTSWSTKETELSSVNADGAQAS